MSESLPPFRIDRLAIVDRQIEDLVRAGASRFDRLRMIALLKFIHKNLAERLLEFGDPVYQTKKQSGTACHRFISPLSVHFVVFETERIVMILDVVDANAL